MWQNNAGGRGRSGCRPCCGATPSAPRPGYSLWTPSLIPSGERGTHMQLLQEHVWIYVSLHDLKNDFSIFEYTTACLHSAWVHVERPVHLHTCTMISKVSRIIMLASVARLPSISASCSSSALVLQSRNQRTWSQNDHHF